MPTPIRDVSRPLVDGELLSGRGRGRAVVRTDPSGATTLVAPLTSSRHTDRKVPWRPVARFATTPSRQDATRVAAAIWVVSNDLAVRRRTVRVVVDADAVATVLVDRWTPGFTARVATTTTAAMPLADLDVTALRTATARTPTGRR